MLALRKQLAVDSDGKITLNIPPEFGAEVEIVVLPITSSTTSADAFLGHAFADDPAEDALWQQYLTGAAL